LQLAVLTEKSHMLMWLFSVSKTPKADATYRIALADAGYFLYFTMDREMPASQNYPFPCRDPDHHLG